MTTLRNGRTIEVRHVEVLTFESVASTDKKLTRDKVVNATIQ